MLTKLERLINDLKQQDVDQADLAGERLSCNDSKELACAIKENDILKKLVLGGIVVGCELGDDGVKNVASVLAENQQLNYLDLRTNQIGNKGATALASALQNNQNLKVLDLRSNPITHQARALFDSVPSSQSGELQIFFDDASL